MIWLLVCAFFVVSLISIFRLLWRSGKWAWILFFGLLASAGAYVGLFVLPVASAPSLQGRPVLLTVILLGGSLTYFGLLFLWIRRMAIKLKSPPTLP